MPVPVSNSKLTFGLFEVDLESGELWKAGFRVKLQTQPFKVLAALLEHPGQIITREELQLRLWGPDTVVDFDHSLGTAINKVREALGDSADSPRYIETLSKRGYRFIAPVSPLPEPPSRLSATILTELPAEAAPPNPEPLAGLREPAPTGPPPASAPARPATPPYPRSIIALAAVLFVTAIVASYLIG